MSWLEKVLPPRIRPNAAIARQQMPEGLWVKCPACEGRGGTVCKKCGGEGYVQKKERK